MRLWFWDPCPFRQRSFHYNGVAWVCANLYFVDLNTTYFEHLLLSNAFSALIKLLRIFGDASKFGARWTLDICYGIFRNAKIGILALGETWTQQDVFIGRKEAERSKYLFFQRKAIFAFWVCRPKLQVHRNNFFYLMYQGGNKTKQRHKIKMKQSNTFISSLKMIQVFFLTQYMMGVHPSMVTHWKVVSMASMMLSKLVIPWFGPVHFSRQIDSLFLWHRQCKFYIIVRGQKSERKGYCDLFIGIMWQTPQVE